MSIGEHGKKALNGEFESTKGLHAVAGDFAPKPIAWGSFKSLPNTHYYVCKFYDLAEELPEPTEFCAKVAELHTKSESPNGKFGFHVVTYNGDLPQENGYADTWEEFFVNGFNHVLNLNIERGGPWEDMESLKLPMLTKVIPRLLRPMETCGRSIKPMLVHGGLWCGNTAVDTQTDRSLIYDPASFYAHNECKRFLPTRFCSVNLFQTSLGAGALNGTNSHVVTSMSTIRTSPSLYLRMIMTIATRYIACKEHDLVLFRISLI